MADLDRTDARPHRSLVPSSSQTCAVSFDSVPGPCNKLASTRRLCSDRVCRPRSDGLALGSVYFVHLVCRPQLFLRHPRPFATPLCADPPSCPSCAFRRLPPVDLARGGPRGCRPVQVPVQSPVAGTWTGGCVGVSSETARVCSVGWSEGRRPRGRDWWGRGRGVSPRTDVRAHVAGAFVTRSLASTAACSIRLPVRQDVCSRRWTVVLVPARQQTGLATATSTTTACIQWGCCRCPCYRSTAACSTPVSLDGLDVRPFLSRPLPQHRPLAEPQPPTRRRGVRALWIRRSRSRSAHVVPASDHHHHHRPRWHRSLCGASWPSHDQPHPPHRLGAPEGSPGVWRSVRGWGDGRKRRRGSRVCAERTEKYGAERGGSGRGGRDGDGDGTTREQWRRDRASGW